MILKHQEFRIPIIIAKGDMFPCSSIYQNLPRTNQTLIKIDDQCYGSFQNVDDRIISDHYDHNPFLPNEDQFSLAYNPLIVPSILEEDEAVMLSHFLSQRQLLACNSQQLAYNHHGHHEKQNPGNRQSRPGKRSNKDRHSKICTAHGLRDRRMRLSLQIARKFFDLQDLLGFDKASRTIDWLFTKSKTAIDELKGSPPSSSGEAREVDVARVGRGNSKDTRRKMVLRESRDKARARARARTREKKMMVERSRQSSTVSVVPGGKTFHGGFDRAEPDNPFQVDFLGFAQNWEMVAFTPPPNSSISKACKLPTSEQPLNPNFQNPRPALDDDSEKQNPNPNFMASLII